MPSPFPGMDPYLEGDFWTTIHSQLVPEFARRLWPVIGSKYAALTEQWYALADPDEDVDRPSRRWPDVAVEIVRDSSVAYSPTGISPPTRRVGTYVPARRRQVRVRILDVKESRVVTIIELLSPANKTGGGYADYVRKRNAIIARGINLLEVDLLHRGRRVPAVGELPQTPYYAFLTREQSVPAMDVWSIRLPDRLPVLPVPLSEGDADVPLDVQACLTAIYEGAGYDRLLRYDRRPPTSLPPEELAWVRELLASRGVDISRWETEEAAE